MTIRSSGTITSRAGGTPLYEGRFEGDSEFVEGLARLTLALIESEQADQRSISVGGRRYEGRIDGRGHSHVPVVAWAENNNLEVTINKAAGRAFMTTSLGDVIIALGAPEVKIGSVWHQIDGVVLADGDEILMPTQIIAILTGR